MPKILAFAASYRKASYNRRILNYAVEGAKKAGGEVTLIELNDFSIPTFDADLEQEKFDVDAARLQKIVADHDRLLIATPEYNRSIPGGLKNVVDWISRPNPPYPTSGVFKGKLGAIMSASPGQFGGIRALDALRALLSNLGMVVLPGDVAVGFASQKFDGDSWEMTDDKLRAILESHGANLVKAANLFPSS